MNQYSVIHSYSVLRTACSFGLLALSQLALLGCAAEDGESSPEGSQPSAAQDMQEHLIADVQLPGYSVSYYELEPGSVLELETGELAARIDEPAGLDPVQRYEYLSGEKAPKALVAALERAGAQGHENDPVPSHSEAIEGTPVAAEKGVARNTPEWFRATYCKPTDRFWGTGGNTLWTGNSSWSDRVEYLNGGVYVQLGELNYRMTYAGGNIREQWYGLSSGMYASWRNTSAINRAASSAVQYANGTDNGPNSVYGQRDVYMHCLNYHY